MRNFLAGADPNPRPGRQKLARTVPAVLLAAVWLVLAIAGCTSDDSNLTGSGLVTDHIDGVLDTLLAADVIQYTGKNILDDRVPFNRQELVYLGSQGGNTSTILVNYDFSDMYAFTDSIGPEAFTYENVVSVKLKMIMPRFYRNSATAEDTASGFPTKVRKVYEVHQLEAPFDSTGTYPGPIPPFDVTDLNTDNSLNDSGEPQIDINPAFLVGWVQAVGQQGLMIQEGLGSVPGLVGFATRENRHMGSQFLPQSLGTTQGPALLVTLADPPITIAVKPYADISTFHELSRAEEDPANGFMMRTCVRSFPVLRFDLSALPANVFINRALLYVVNDTTSSFGNLESMVVSEYDMDLIGVPGDYLPLTDLDSATYSIAIMNSLDPTYHTRLQFNVTSAIQRITNSVYEGDRGFIITAGEEIFPDANLSTAVTPDFYFNQYNFFGTAADDTLRPQLRITYSYVDDIVGGGE